MTVVDKASRFGHHKRMDSGGSSATLRPARKMKQKAHLHATKRCREDHDPNREKEREWKRKTKQVCFSLTIGHTGHHPYVIRRHVHVHVGSKGVAASLMWQLTFVSLFSLMGPVFIFTFGNRLIWATNYTDARRAAAQISCPGSIQCDWEH
jgi:uncharacterized protein YaaW (UPF0174 family)